MTELEELREKLKKLKLGIVGSEGRPQIRRLSPDQINRIMKLITSHTNKAVIDEVKFIDSFNPTNYKEFKQVIEGRLAELKVKHE